MELVGLSNSFSANYTVTEVVYERLAEMANNLREAHETGQSKKVIDKLGKELVYYAQCYCVSEEQRLW